MKEWFLSPPGLLLLWLLLVNLIGFCAMGIDKHRAKKDTWRIPEKRLFLWALLGGTVGCLLGMKQFHHKTKHRSFTWGMPAILIAQILLVLALLLWRIGVLGA